MDTGALYSAAIGSLFFLLGAEQWFRPEYHRLSRLVDRSDAPETGEKAQQGVNSVVRAMAAAGMYVAGLFLALAWVPVFDRLYAIFVQIAPGLGP